MVGYEDTIDYLPCLTCIVRWFLEADFSSFDQEHTIGTCHRSFNNQVHPIDNHRKWSGEASHFFQCNSCCSLAFKDIDLLSRYFTDFDLTCVAKQCVDGWIVDNYSKLFVFTDKVVHKDICVCIDSIL